MTTIPTCCLGQRLKKCRKLLNPFIYSINKYCYELETIKKKTIVAKILFCFKHPSFQLDVQDASSQLFLTIHPPFSFCILIFKIEILITISYLILPNEGSIRNSLLLSVTCWWPHLGSLRWLHTAERSPGGWAQLRRLG